ncbi:hypothetical protein Tco_1486030 [Tanacetum coccineum]
MEQKCVTTKQFWKTHKEVNQVLHQGVSQLAEQATEELIENNLKPCIAATIIAIVMLFVQKYQILFLKILMHKHQILSKNSSRIMYKAMLFKFILSDDIK